MRLIIVPLAIIIFASLFSTVITMAESDVFGLGDTFYGRFYSGDVISGGNSTLDGTTQRYDSDVAPVQAEFSSAFGALVAVTVTVAMIAVAGVTVVGSGIKEISVKALGLSAFYYGMWGVFSVLGSRMLNAIPIFGVLLYILLTIVYSLGVIEAIGR